MDAGVSKLVPQPTENGLHLEIHVKWAEWFSLYSPLKSNILSNFGQTEKEAYTWDEATFTSSNQNSQWIQLSIDWISVKTQDSGKWTQTLCQISEIIVTPI